MWHAWNDWLYLPFPDPRVRLLLHHVLVELPHPRSTTGFWKVPGEVRLFGKEFHVPRVAFWPFKLNEVEGLITQVQGVMTPLFQGSWRLQVERWELQWYVCYGMFLWGMFLWGMLMLCFCLLPSCFRSVAFFLGEETKVPWEGLDLQFSNPSHNLLRLDEIHFAPGKPGFLGWCEMDSVHPQYQHHFSQGQRCSRCCQILSQADPFRNRDPYIIHLNIALQMVVSLYFGGTSHVSNGQNVSFKEPCVTALGSCRLLSRHLSGQTWKLHASPFFLGWN